MLMSRMPPVESSPTSTPEPGALRPRRFLVGLFALSLVLGAGGLFVLRDLFDDRPITIAAHLWPGYEMLFLAAREGWLDSDQARILETLSASDSLQALAEGRVDGAALTLDEVLRARADGTELAVVAVFNLSAGADMLLARPSITRLEDIAGHAIGVEQGAVGALMFAEALRAAGLNPEDVTPVQLTIDEHLAAWEQGRIDACITFEPIASQLLARGAVKLFDSRRIPETIVDVLAIRPEALTRRHAQAVRHLIASHFRGLEHLHRNPQDAAHRIAGHLNLPAADALLAFKGLVLPDVRANRRLLAGEEPDLATTARKLSRFLVGQGLIGDCDDLAGLIRPDFLPPTLILD